MDHSRSQTRGKGIAVPPRTTVLRIRENLCNVLCSKSLKNGGNDNNEDYRDLVACDPGDVGSGMRCFAKAASWALGHRAGDRDQTVERSIQRRRGPAPTVLPRRGCNTGVLQMQV